MLSRRLQPGAARHGAMMVLATCSLMRPGLARSPAQPERFHVPCSELLLGSAGGPGCAGFASRHTQFCFSFQARTCRPCAAVDACRQFFPQRVHRRALGEGRCKWYVTCPNCQYGVLLQFLYLYAADLLNSRSMRRSTVH